MLHHAWGICVKKHDSSQFFPFVAHLLKKQDFVYFGQKVDILGASAGIFLRGWVPILSIFGSFHCKKNTPLFPYENLWIYDTTSESCFLNETEEVVIYLPLFQFIYLY